MTELHPIEFNIFKTLKNLSAKRIGIVVQVSGGHDSMCLANALLKVQQSILCQKQMYIYLHVQHFNHKQRATESDGDQYFVEDWAKKHQITFESNNKDDKKSEVFFNQKNSNFQNHARQWRKEFGKNTAKQIKNSEALDVVFVATAHHLRDAVESLLMHLIRGSGLYGFVHMEMFDKEKIFFRPFIKTEYDILKKYSSEKKISFREDSSNHSMDYTRNRIRQKILPELQSINSQYQKHILHFSQAIQETLQNMQHSDKVTTSAGLPLTPLPSLTEIQCYGRQVSSELQNFLGYQATINIYQHILKYCSAETRNKAQSVTIPLTQHWQVVLKSGMLKFEKLFSELT